MWSYLRRQNCLALTRVEFLTRGALYFGVKGNLKQESFAKF